MVLTSTRGPGAAQADGDACHPAAVRVLAPVASAGVDPFQLHGQLLLGQASDGLSAWGSYDAGRMLPRVIQDASPSKGADQQPGCASGSGLAAAKPPGAAALTKLSSQSRARAAQRRAHSQAHLHPACNTPTLAPSAKQPGALVVTGNGRAARPALEAARAPSSGAQPSASALPMPRQLPARAVVTSDLRGLQTRPPSRTHNLRGASSSSSAASMWPQQPQGRQAQAPLAAVVICHRAGQPSARDAPAPLPAKQREQQLPAQPARTHQPQRLCRVAGQHSSPQQGQCTQRPPQPQHRQPLLLLPQQLLQPAAASIPHHQLLQQPSGVSEEALARRRRRCGGLSYGHAAVMVSRCINVGTCAPQDAVNP